MPYPSLSFPNTLDNATRHELEQFISLLQGYLSAEHGDDGTHTDVTADTVTADAITADAITADSVTADAITVTTLDATSVTTLRVTERLGPPAITANQNDYNPTDLATAFKLYIASDAAWDITGLQATAEGHLLWIWNYGGFTISLKHQDVSSSAANRFYTATGADVAIRAGGSVLVQYDVGAFGTGAWVVLGA